MSFFLLSSAMWIFKTENEAQEGNMQRIKFFWNRTKWNLSGQLIRVCCCWFILKQRKSEQNKCTVILQWNKCETIGIFFLIPRIYWDINMKITNKKKNRNDNTTKFIVDMCGWQKIQFIWILNNKFELEIP